MEIKQSSETSVQVMWKCFVRQRIKVRLVKRVSMSFKKLKTKLIEEKFSEWMAKKAKSSIRCQSGKFGLQTSYLIESMCEKLL